MKTLPAAAIHRARLSPTGSASASGLDLQCDPHSSREFGRAIAYPYSR